LSGSAAAVVTAVVLLAAAAAAGVAAAATEHNDDENEPQAGIVAVSVMEAHADSPRFKTLGYSMRRTPEWGLTIEKKKDQPKDLCRVFWECGEYGGFNG